MRLDILATFDCLYLGSHLQRRLNGFTAAEIHLLTYLACLLWIYRGKPQTDWGYNFSGTEYGAPFSVSVNTAVQALERRGFFTKSQGRLEMAEPAEEQLASISGHILYQDRLECLRAAAASITAFSVDVVREALGQEPELHRAKELPGSRTLLEEPALKALYQQFDVLREALGNTRKDLRLPAIVWLTALFENSQKEGAAQT